VLKNRAGRMIENEYPWASRLHCTARISPSVSELARSVGAQLPVTTLAAGYEDALIEEGHGDDDNSAWPARFVDSRP